MTWRCRGSEKRQFERNNSVIQFIYCIHIPCQEEIYIMVYMELKMYYNIENYMDLLNLLFSSYLLFHIRTTQQYCLKPPFWDRRMGLKRRQFCKRYNTVLCHCHRLSAESACHNEKRQAKMSYMQYYSPCGGLYVILGLAWWKSYCVMLF